MRTVETNVGVVGTDLQAWDYGTVAQLSLYATQITRPSNKASTREADVSLWRRAICSLGQALGLEKVDQRQLNATLDLLLEQRHRIEAALARRLKGGTAVLEQAFRSLETFDLKIRPTYHRLRAHDLLCMLAYHVEWHMREALKPVLFDDHDELAVEGAHRSVVVAAPRFEASQCNAATEGTDNLPVHSFRSLMADLATFTRNTRRWRIGQTPLSAVSRAYAGSAAHLPAS